MSVDVVGLLALAVVFGGFLVAMLVLSSLLGPKNKNAIRQLPFECGVVTEGAAGQRFSVRFYLVAMLFILFDVEIIFMYPWAVNVSYLGWSGFFAMLSFIVVLAVGLVYIFKNNILDVR